MTVSTTATTVTLNGNGVTTSFNYSFEIPYQDDGVTPAVTVTTLVAGVATILTPSQYTIFNVGNPAGGSVTYTGGGTPLPAGGTITIARSKALTQPYAFPNASFEPTQVEAALDNVVLEMQQLQAAVATTTGVTSVAVSGGSTGLTVSGSPIISTGTITLGGVLAVASGGTGATSPSLIAGTGVSVTGSWPNQTISSTSGGGTVTSVSGSGGITGLTLTGGPITSSGTLTIGGVLAVANGGTGVTVSTGSTTLVLANTPTLATPVVSGALKFNGATSGNVQVQAPATPTSYTLTLPSTAGTNTYVLTTDGTGVCSWVANGAGSGVTLLSFGTTGLTPSTGTSGSITVAGTLATTNGGTGLTSFTSGGAIYASSSSALTTGTLPVTAGGTGAATLTGILKGTGTSAIGAATAGTDYAAPGTATTFTATQTFSGSTSVAAASFLNLVETFFSSSSAPSSTQVLYANNGTVQYFTSNAANNFIVNLVFSAGTSLGAALSTGQAISFTLLTTQGSTAYYCTAVQVDGTTSGVTTVWQGGTAPASGNASGIDVYTFTVMKTGTGAYTVLATQVKF